MQTDRTFRSYTKDIVIRDYEKGTFLFLDTAISGDRNVIERVAEKILQNKYLTIETERVCNVNKKVIPVSIEATGTFS